MIIQLKIPDSLTDKLDSQNLVELEHFLQHQLNRYCVGELRYGKANARKKYLTRLKKELKSYIKAGNAEQLFNIANYALLESICPEHKKQHWDASVDSVTRYAMKINI